MPARSHSRSWIACSGRTPHSRILRLVLVIDQTYSPDVALTLFRMGVDEYLCMSHHGGRLAAIVSQLLTNRGIGRSRSSRHSRRCPDRPRVPCIVPARASHGGTGLSR